MYKATLNHTGNLFAPAKADELAAELNSDVEDDFVYTVVHCPKGTGLSFVTITDEDGHNIGKL